MSPSRTPTWQLALRLSISGTTPRQAFKLALVVGTLLVLINQWGAFFGSQIIRWPELVLTYCVPYFVSTYTSVSKDLAENKPEST